MQINRLTVADICTDYPETRVEWLWEGLVLSKALTLLVSPSKVGKTTLMSHLLKQMQTGGSLFGHHVQEGKAVVISEECIMHWRHRCERLGLGDKVTFLCRPFLFGRPTREEFREWAELVTHECSLDGTKLIVLDTLGEFLGGIENNSAALTEALEPFRYFAAQGGAVLILHHPRKASSKPGRAARGSGALTGMVDTVIELDGDGALPSDRQRTLRLWSRFDVIPELVYELDPDGKQAAVITETPLPTTEESVEQILTHSEYTQTLTEISHKWPEGHPPVKPHKLLKILSTKTASGQLVRTGKGLEGSPYRYRLASRDVKQNPFDFDNLVSPLPAKNLAEVFAKVAGGDINFLKHAMRAGTGKPT